jgi:hypothetical protein
MAIRERLLVKRGLPVIWALLALALLALPLAFAQRATKPAPVTGTGPKTTGGQEVVKPVTPKSGGWKEVDRLVSEQKYEAAATQSEKILAAAKARADEPEWTKALVRLTQLRMGLHGYETAVRRLRDEPWPKAPLQHAVLDLFYAHAIVEYCQSYSWEIGKRERVEAKGEVDLKAWTRDQLYAEAQRAYLDVWRQRADLGSTPVTTLKEYITPNDYPAGVRDTLRDAVSYLYADLLADSSFWTAEQSNDLFRLDRTQLLADGPRGQASDVLLADASAHPLQKLVAVLGDLETWHASRGHREAELEARLERLRRLHEALDEAADRALVLRDLTSRLEGFRSVPWWSMGKALEAEFTRETDRPDALVLARGIAMAGRKAYPASVGGQRCDNIVQSIEAPDFQIAGMSLDGADRRSLGADHRTCRRSISAYPVTSSNASSAGRLLPTAG